MRDKFLKGKLILYSDQGMEGGYLSIFDEKFISLKPPTFGITEDRKVWDKDDTSKSGMTSKSELYLDNTWVTWPDPIYQDPDYKKSSLYLEKQGDLCADNRLSERYNIMIKYVDDILNEKFGESNWKYKSEKKSEIVLNNGELMHIGYSPISVPKRPYGIPENGLTRVTVKWNNGSVEEKRLSDTLLIEQWSYEGLHQLKEFDYLKVIDPQTNGIICEGQIDLIPLKIFSQTKKGHFENSNDGNWEKCFEENYYAELYR